MTENWKPVIGYEGYYEVSDLGRVMNSKTGYILTPYPNEKGYLRVILFKNGKMSHKRIHRLVADAFIPNPMNYPHINHKDENKTNNCVNNLEWCNPKYNINYGTAVQRIKNTLRNYWEEQKELQTEPSLW